MSGLGEFFYFVGIVDYAVSVSYTHLDVYKRQTLLQIMGTLDEPDAGVVQIDGTVVSRMKEKDCLLYTSRCV